MEWNTTELIQAAVNSPYISALLIFIKFIASMFFGVYTEHKFNIFSRLRKLESRIFNYKTEMKVNITYKTKKDFEMVKTSLKDYFIGEYKEYNLLDEKISHITINFDIFTAKIIQIGSDEIFIDIFKTGCGINDLKDKVANLISTLNKIDRTKGLFQEMVSCDITIYLPYNWSYIKIYPPKGYKLGNYQIDIQDNSNYKTKVQLSLNSINACGNSFEEINHLLQKLL